MKICSIELPSGEVISLGDEVCYVDTLLQEGLKIGIIQSFGYNEDSGENFCVHESINEYPLHYLLGTKKTIQKMLE